MAPSIVDSTFSQPQPDAGSAVNAVTQGNTQGLDAGLALAHGQQQAQAMGQQLETMKTQATIQKGSYMMNLMDKIQQTQNPKVRGLYADNYNDFASKNGMPPMDDSVYDYIKSVPDSNSILSQLVKQYPHVASDPTQAVQFVAGFAKAMGLPLADAEKEITPLLQAGQSAMYKNMMLMNQGRKMDQADERIQLQQGKTAQGVLNKSMNDQPVKDSETILNGAQKATSIINKGLADYKKGNGTVTWSQIHEVAGDLAGITSVKPSAITAVAKQEGVEADLPKISALLGRIDTESKQGPSKTVPVEVLQQFKEQVGNIKTVMAGIHDHEVASRLQSGIATNTLTPAVAEPFFQGRQRSGAKNISQALVSGYDQDNSQQSAPAASPTPAAAPSPVLQNPQTGSIFKQIKSSGMTYQQLSPIQQQKISQKDYDSL